MIFLPCAIEHQNHCSTRSLFSVPSASEPPPRVTPFSLVTMGCCTVREQRVQAVLEGVRPAKSLREGKKWSGVREWMGVSVLAIEDGDG